jgi:uncharacterized tellurite resistance protein B-like protein
MSLLRFLGLGSNEGSAGGDRADETGTIGDICAHLDRLPSESALFLAAFACVLGRVAHADLSIDAEEIEEMKRAVHDTADLGDAEVDIVVEIATAHIREFGGTESYLATRSFREQSTREQRARLLNCLYAVAAADGTISTTESSEVSSVGEELGFTRAEVMGLRSAWKDKLAEFQAAPPR